MVGTKLFQLTDCQGDCVYVRLYQLYVAHVSGVQSIIRGIDHFC